MYDHHGQTLYTPVFPTTGRSNTLSRSLSHLHLALASIPAELAPPSRPSSPGFRARRQAVYENICTAYNAAGGQTSHPNWARVHRLVDMTCTRSKFKKSATRVERKDPEEGVPWILAETEEEWAEWEKTREKLRSKLRRSDTEVMDQQGLPPTPSTSSKRASLRDKVKSWKAQVDRSFDGEDDTVHDPGLSSPAVVGDSQPPSTKKRVSSLDFPVIKPSTLKAHKDSKAKDKLKKKTPKPSTAGDLLRQSDCEVPHASDTDVNQKYPHARKRAISKSALIPPSSSQAVASTPDKQQGRQNAPAISVDGPLPFPPPKASMTRILGLTTPESQEAQRAAAKKRSRPLSQSTTGNAPVDSGSLPSPKRQKTATSNLCTPLPVRNDIPATPSRKQGVFGSGVPVSRTKKIPVRPLGAAEGFEDVDDMEVIGRVTPKKRERSTTPLLASSHKVMPRPRPSTGKSSPLKQSLAPPFGSDQEDEDLIPRGSPKVYFSSPASSTPSTPPPRKSKGQVSPGSPSLFGHLNRDFTMNPEAFAPLFTSTQNGPEGDGSGGGGRPLSRKGTGNSMGLFKFNSQLDVNKRVEDTVALLERDVDADNWFVDLDGADLTVGADE